MPRAATSPRSAVCRKHRSSRARSSRRRNLPARFRHTEAHSNRPHASKVLFAFLQRGSLLVIPERLVGLARLFRELSQRMVGRVARGYADAGIQIVLRLAPQLLVQAQLAEREQQPGIVLVLV